MIARHFFTADAANEFYLDLCEDYDSVQFISGPLFGGAGRYVWRVTDPS